LLDVDVSGDAKKKRSALKLNFGGWGQTCAWRRVAPFSVTCAVPAWEGAAFFQERAARREGW